MKEINIKLPCKAWAYLGVFTNGMASGLTIKACEVVVTSYNPDTGYCDMTDMEGNTFTEVNLTNVGFDLKNN